MFGYYTPLLILQAFCLYHAYKNNMEQRWYWLIIFLPGVGCALYLYHSFYNRNNVQTLKQGLREVVNSNYQIEQLEKQLRFVDNVANKTLLGDAYMSAGRYGDALSLYKDCLSSGFMAEDPDLRMKALQACFMNQDHTEAIAYGDLLEPEKSFKNSESRIAYAWSLHYNGKTETAEVVFEDLNKSFTNYKHRLEYCKFLKETRKPDTLRDLLTVLVEEFDHMKPLERRHHRTIINEVKEMARRL